jgi:hypothetical protein
VQEEDGTWTEEAPISMHEYAIRLPYDSEFLPARRFG